MNNTTTYTYYTSRTAARNATSTDVKFKDHGADAPKGERWSTYSLTAAMPTLATAVLATIKPKKVDGTSKKAVAIGIITTMLAEGNSRKEVLAKLVADVGLTAPGASTYYANVKKGTWS